MQAQTQEQDKADWSSKGLLQWVSQTHSMNFPANSAYWASVYSRTSPLCSSRREHKPWGTTQMPTSHPVWIMAIFLAWDWPVKELPGPNKSLLQTHLAWSNTYWSLEWRLWEAISVSVFFPALGCSYLFPGTFFCPLPSRRYTNLKWQQLLRLQKAAVNLCILGGLDKGKGWEQKIACFKSLDKQPWRDVGMDAGLDKVQVYNSFQDEHFSL